MQEYRKVIDAKKHIIDIWGEGGDGHYTCQDDIYIKYLKKMIPKFNGGRILEIGPGSGQFALRIIRKYNILSKQYYMLDLSKNIVDSKSLLEDNQIEANYTVSQNYKELFGTKFDLLTSNICIPELPHYYRDDLLRNILPNCSHAIIIGQLTGKWAGPKDEYKQWIFDLFAQNFTTVNSELIPYKNCYAVVGK